MPESPESDSAPFLAIIAGGSGTRLWPKSRRQKPKHLLSFDGKLSLLRQTFERVAPLTCPERIVVVTSAAQADQIAVQLPEIDRSQIIAEPSGKGTAPAVAAAAALTAANACNPTLITVGSDHFVGDDEAFRQSLRAAAAAARKFRGLLTVGIRPSGPDTGMGYIELGDPAGTFDGVAVHETTAFVEKPDRPTAEAFFAGGRHFWNCNYFAFTTDALLAAFSIHAPHLAVAMHQLTESFRNGQPENALAKVWSQLTVEAIDTAVMEKADNVYTVPADFAWADIGTWEGVYKISRRVEAAGNNQLAGIPAQTPVFVNSQRCLVDAESALVAVVGLGDVVVVEAGDAILVCAREFAQQIPAVLAQLNASGRSQFL